MSLISKCRIHHRHHHHVSTHMQFQPRHANDFLADCNACRVPEATGPVINSIPHLVTLPSASTSLVTSASTTPTMDQQPQAASQYALSQPQLPAHLQVLPHSSDLHVLSLTTAAHSAAPTEQASPDTSSAAPSESRRERRRARRREKKAEVSHHLSRLCSIASADVDTATTAAAAAWSGVSSTAVESLEAAQKAFQSQISRCFLGISASLDSSALTLSSQLEECCTAVWPTVKRIAVTVALTVALAYTWALMEGAVSV